MIDEDADARTILGARVVQPGTQMIDVRQQALGARRAQVEAKR